MVADVDQVVGDHPQADPPLYSLESTIAASIKTVASLQHADASLASRPPSLPGSEPALLLPSPALLASRTAVGDRYPLHSHRPKGVLILL